MPVAFEIPGAIGPQPGQFLKEFGHHIKLITGERRSAVFIVQRLLVAIHTDNVAFVVGNSRLGTLMVFCLFCFCCFMFFLLYNYLINIYFPLVFYCIILILFYYYYYC